MTIDLSLITSSYQAEAFLERYVQRVLSVLESLQSTLSIELIIVANDIISDEREMLLPLEHIADSSPHFSLKLLEVPRESLYASWNRGVKYANGTAVGFWNVDDVRFADAIIQGVEQIQSGCELVYFPYHIIKQVKLLRLIPRQRITHFPAHPYQQHDFIRTMRFDPFFLFKRTLFDQVGDFETDFKITGDYEWLMRAFQHTNPRRVDTLSGEFYIHGDNLSSTGNPRQKVEENIALLWHDAWDGLHPVNPQLMKQLWDEWGHKKGIQLPEAIQRQLWGDDAEAHWQTSLAEREQIERNRTLRAFPKWLMEKLGLRPLFARLGIVKSAESHP